MQGHLRGESLTILLKTECAHCDRPIRLRIDSDLGYALLSEGAAPIVFVPMVDFSKLDDPSIDVDSIPGITPGEKIVAHALQTYGAYCRDTAGAKLAFSFEDPAGKPNPYPELGFPWDYYDMPHIPWNHLRVLSSWSGS